jgi:hypothetical protein
LFTNLDECNVNNCPGTNTLCKWDSSVNRCGCPSTSSTTGSQVHDCSFFTNPNDCGVNKCPGTNVQCKWESTVNRCGCPSTSGPASTTGTTGTDYLFS